MRGRSLALTPCQEAAKAAACGFDLDSDGAPDADEGSADTDGDGLPDSTDPDSDGDSEPDAEEGSVDSIPTDATDAN